MVCGVVEREEALFSERFLKFVFIVTKNVVGLAFDAAVPAGGVRLDAEAVSGRDAAVDIGLSSRCDIEQRVGTRKRALRPGDCSLVGLRFVVAASLFGGGGCLHAATLRSSLYIATLP